MSDRHVPEITALVVYAALLGALVFAPAWVPDEVWFFRDAARLRWTDYLTQSPDLGYGAAWWSAYALLRATLPGVGAAWAMRAVAWAGLASIPVALTRGAVERSSARWAVALWLALPVAWWTGKLAAPEVPSLVAAAWSLTLAGRRDRWRWVTWLLVGVAVGLKVTAVVVLPVVLAVAWRSRPTVDDLARKGALVALGFAVVNPCFVTRPRAAWTAIVGAGSRWSLFAESRVLWSPAWTWDGVASGGLFAQGVSLYAALAVLAALVVVARRDREARALVTGALGLVVMGAALYLRHRFLLWYTFPALVALCALVGRLPLRDGAARWCVAAALVAQGVHGVPQVVAAAHDRVAHARALARLPVTTRTVAAVVREGPRPDLYVDLAEVGRGLGLPPETPVEAGTVVRELDAQYALLNGQRAGRAVVVLGDRLRPLPFYRATLDGGLWRANYALERTRHVEGATVWWFRAAGRAPRPPTSP